jgi:hypothetical protein
LNDINNDDRLSNVVPLCGELNKMLAGYHIQRTNVYHPPLLPENLLKKADEHFSVGWYLPAAYGCAHLAFQIARRYNRFSAAEQLPILRKAVYYARHAYHDDIVPELLLKPGNASQPITDVGLLELIHEGAALEDLSEVCQLLQELAALCNEGGDVALADEIRQLMEQAYHTFETSQGVSEGSRANFIRRVAHIRTSNRNEIDVVPRLLSQSAELDSAQSFNRKITEVFRLIALGDRRVRDNIERDLLSTLGDRSEDMIAKTLPVTAAGASGTFLLGALLNAQNPEKADRLFLHSQEILQSTRHRLPRHYPDFWSDATRLLAPKVGQDKIGPFQKLIRPALPDVVTAKIREALHGVLKKRIFDI